MGWHHVGNSQYIVQRHVLTVGYNSNLQNSKSLENELSVKYREDYQCTKKQIIIKLRKYTITTNVNIQ